ncbi:MAG: DUF1016 N-terminal domain-containing protein [Desulfococcaceae bacterium]|jgi:hypothetical protein|nr:DUF1016 N-terminal domain-containing protein [Desulfococcaceae bacterium]
MINQNLYIEISRLIQEARNKVVQSVNWTMVITYWEIGKRIVEEEQHGQNRTEYGRFLIKTLSEKLTREFGKGFDKRNLFYMRQFYLTFPIMNALRSQLSWTHYRLLMKISRSKSFPRIRFYGCPGVQKVYFCTAASPG